MKILLDTNIIIDVALSRQPFFEDSQQILLLVEQNRIYGYISASTVGDLYYIIRRARGREWTMEFLNWLVTFCQIATVNETVIEMALNLNFFDFEDAIQYSTAVINQLDAIVTRNPQDFPVTSPRIITPGRLVQELTDSGKA
ncbi:PilT protein domain protein (plasmid) [Gloeothece citriformis PCC 7424]|uniref:PilT protein domain protein n=1 Tax=Gloeothece citriformis (strain PCC 7424) TaxID=65393 RepID=B7KMU8_GLOC7|nr:PIN domain-containing protein [Gloeothece citriformis]ACK74120.1 PilT protein domain protein [Gloeothece citriformis PCC 7424]